MSHIEGMLHQSVASNEGWHCFQQGTDGYHDCKESTGRPLWVTARGCHHWSALQTHSMPPWLGSISHTGAKGFLGIGLSAPAISPDVFQMLINTAGNSCQAGLSRPCWDPAATGPNLQLHTGGHRSPILPPAPPVPLFDDAKSRTLIQDT